MGPRILAGCLGLALTGAAGAGLALYLESHAAYRSPLARPEPAWTPRKQALADLQEAARKRQEEERRRAELRRSLTPEKMAQLGKEIVSGKGKCFNCHSIGSQGGGTQGPNLEGIGARAAQRVQGMSDVEYLAQSLYYPGAYVVEGFPPAMIPADEPPIDLTDEEILSVIAYLQSLGSEPTVSPGAQLRPEAEGLGPAP